MKAFHFQHFEIPKQLLIFRVFFLKSNQLQPKNLLNNTNSYLFVRRTSVEALPHNVKCGKFSVSRKLFSPIITFKLFVFSNFSSFEAIFYSMRARLKYFNMAYIIFQFQKDECSAIKIFQSEV